MPEPDTPLSERPWEDVDLLLSVDEVRDRVLASVQPLSAVTLPLLAARGLRLVDAVTAEGNVPPFRNSAMDGYAVVAADTASASFAAPVRLRVGVTVAAGSSVASELEPGTAIRIMTGAPLPVGADAVVRFEETDEATAARRPDRSGWVEIYRPAQGGDNVRDAGEDVAAGAVILVAGRRLRPPDLGLLAALGSTMVRVGRRPRVAVLSTGNEIAPPGAPLAPGLICDSNGTTLAAMADSWGAEVVPFGIVGDCLDSVRERLRAAQGVDLIVTSGGVSVGDYDLVKDALQAEGDIAIWQVRMKPGKPLAFGWAGAVPLLGLPGNPVAAAVSFEVFGRPAIRRMLGYNDGDCLPPTVRVSLAEPLENRGMRRHFVRVVLERGATGEWEARPTGAQGAGVLTSLSQADALLIVPETVDQADKGMQLDAILLD